jgi:hypothetical protein
MVSAIADALAAGQATENQLSAATDFAHAQVELARIHAIRAEQWARINRNEGLEDNTKALRRLASLDRYERYAIAGAARCRKASGSNIRQRRSLLPAWTFPTAKSSRRE